MQSGLRAQLLLDLDDVLLHDATARQLSIDPTRLTTKAVTPVAEKEDSVQLCFWLLAKFSPEQIWLQRWYWVALFRL